MSRATNPYPFIPFRPLAISEADGVGWIDAGEWRGWTHPRGPVVPLAEVVAFGMGCWSQEVIEETLGYRNDSHAESTALGV